MTSGLRDEIRRAREELRAEGLSLNPITAHRILWRALKREHASPGRLAAAVGVGIFVGCVPIFPHFVLSIIVAYALKLNKMVAALATNISNPLFAPFMIFAEIQVGYLLLEGRFTILSVEQLRAMGLAQVLETFFLAMLLGSLVVGSLAATLATGLVYLVLNRKGRSARPGD